MAKAKSASRYNQFKFDEIYYRACYEHLLKDEPDPKSHFENVGWKIGLNPNALFSTNHYLAANPGLVASDESAFEHFTANPKSDAIHLSAVFDPQFYADSNPDVRSTRDAFQHYWEKGAGQGRSPSALFDPVHYRSQLSRPPERDADLLVHYLTQGWKDGLAPHPLFDPDYYRGQISAAGRKIAPLAHYVETGWRQGISPHVLFDPAYYVENLDREPREPPLAHYLKADRWDTTPHYLFSDLVYTSNVEQSALRGSAKDYHDGAPLLHYVRTGARYGITPHPLFDISYYRQAAEREIKEKPFADDELALLERSPLEHYCSTGFASGLSPTPLFDPDFYVSQIGTPVKGDPFRDYCVGGYAVASPHPGVDLDYYARQRAQYQASDLPAVLDLLMLPREQRVSMHPSFDPQFYLDRNSDIRDSGTCPIRHFLEHGMKEKRQPNRLFTYPYAHRLSVPGRPGYANPVDGYFRARGHKRRRVLFLGHDASRSGAPLVLLALVKHLSAIDDIECITILGRGGPLVDDYVHASFTYIVENNDTEFLEWNRHSNAFKAEMSTIADELRANPPDLIVCNSLESRHLCDFFHTRGFGPIVTLVHEVADPYDTAQLARVFDQSELSVFVSEYQLGRMQKKLSFDEDAATIVQFGALDARFGNGDREEARRKLRAELGLGDEALLVLGCGTMNFRKGIDLFAEVACEVLSRSEAEKRDVHFVWVGGGETHYDSAHYWAYKTITDAGFGNNVHFLGGQAQTERYYLASDIFVLTSRADPYPCVIQEALACALPIVSFENRSGAAEAFGESGIAVPFGTIPMAEAVLGLIKDDKDRAKRAARARALHESAPTLPEYASSVFARFEGVAPELAGLIADKQTPQTGKNEHKVLLALDNWDHSEPNLFAEHLVSTLNGCGLAAELLFIRGQQVFERGEKPLRPPAAPFRFLYPKSDSPEHIRDELYRLFADLPGATTFIPFSSRKCYDLLHAMPTHVAPFEILHGNTDEMLDRIYAFSHYFDRIVCTSPVTASLLLRANGSLETRLAEVVPRIDAPAPARKGKAKERSADPGEPLKLVATLPGTIDAALGSLRLVRLMREAKVPLHLSVFADQAEVRAIRSVAPDLIKSGVVTLHDREESEARLDALAQGDMFLATRGSTGCEINLLEALSRGCVPILLATDKAAVAYLKDGKHALISEADSSRRLVGILKDLHENRARLAEMSGAARALFDEQFADEARMAKEIADLVRMGSRSEARRELRWKVDA